VCAKKIQAPVCGIRQSTGSARVRRCFHTVQAQNLLARTHHYADAPARKYDSLYFKPEETRVLLAAMAQHGDIGQALREDSPQDIERAYHQPRMRGHAGSGAGFYPAIIRWQKHAVSSMKRFQGLAGNIKPQIDDLLDPANGRADILPGGAPTATVEGFPSAPRGSASIFFFGRYDGTFKDLSVIAHERRTCSPSPAYEMKMACRRLTGTAPNFLFGSFAEFNEFAPG